MSTTAGPNTLTLADLGLDPADDVGRTWHPKREKFCADGTLPDLTDDEVAEHLRKPEAAAAEALLAAEDSAETPEGVV